uniref:HDC14861 n=1 Tax=Drosophila melanogaster TaxID=7227 RepID=Q6IJI3_DROME|nr:TPA_inf: HDC14861 [Drosophila melanogaster]
MLRGSILAASLVVPKESEMEMGNGDGDGDGNGKRGKSTRGEDVCPTTTGFTIGQLVLFSVFPLLSHLATRAIFRRCLGVNRIIWAVNEYGRVGHDRYVTVMLMTLMSRKRGHQLAEINDDKCPQMLPQLGVDAFKSINAAGK